MSLDFCCKCGCWIGSLEGQIRLSSDGNAEVVCDTCFAIEQRACKLTDDTLIAKPISAEIIDCRACPCVLDRAEELN